MKIFSASIQTETNTFSPFPTSETIFEETYLTRGGQDKFNPNFWGAPMVAFEKLSRKNGYEYIESLCVAGEPAGIVPKQVYEKYRDEILSDLKKVLPIDIVFLNLHGAMVAEGYEDCEGDIISKVREIVGDQTIIAVELDLHTHLTSIMQEKADLLVAFKYYPHTDVTDRAVDLFHLAVQCKKNDIKPMKASFDCRMINLYPTALEPIKSIMKEIISLEKESDLILNISLIHGFPWGDTPDMGMKVLVTTNTQFDPKGHQAYGFAKAIGEKIYSQRERTKLNLLSLEDVNKKLQYINQYPVTLADFSDNPGVGGMGDATFLVEALLDNGVESIAVATLYDPVVVKQCENIAIGESIEIGIGGKHGATSGNVISGTWKVKFKNKNLIQKFKGCELTLGTAIVLSDDKIDIIVNNVRSQTYSPDVFYNMGIDPLQKKVLVVKSCEHFRATFQKISDMIFQVTTPGVANMNFKEINYQKLQRDMWPIFENPLEK